MKMSEGKDSRHHGESSALTASEIYDKYKDAIVRIETLSQRVDDSPFITNGTGFFIGGQHIITAASVILYSGGGARVPPPPTPPGPAFAIVSNIYVHVYNVGDKGKNFIYKATVVGVDGAGDFALLRIPCDDPWNITLPSLKGQPHFRFSSSRDYTPGHRVFSISNAEDNDFRSVSQGVVRNNRQFSTNAQAFTTTSSMPPEELVLTDIIILNPGSYGSPIITACGNVIGVITLTYGGNSFPFNGSASGGVSEHFFRPVLEAFLEAEKIQAKAFHTRIIAGKCDTDTSRSSGSECEPDPFRNLEVVQDSVGAYFRYIKGYLGISWTGYNVDIFGQVPNNQFKQTQGIIISSVDLSTPVGQFFFPFIDGGQLVLLTWISDCPIGNLPPQITPALVTWRLIAGDTVTLRYRLSGDGFAKELSATLVLAVFPDTADLPTTFVMAPRIAKVEADKASGVNTAQGHDVKGAASSQVDGKYDKNASRVSMPDISCTTEAAPGPSTALAPIVTGAKAAHSAPKKALPMKMVPFSKVLPGEKSPLRLRVI